MDSKPLSACSSESNAATNTPTRSIRLGHSHRPLRLLIVRSIARGVSCRAVAVACISLRAAATISRPGAVAGEEGCRTGWTKRLGGPHPPGHRVRRRSWPSPTSSELAARRLTISLVVAALSILLIVNLVRDLQGFLTMIFMALFLSFAVEPATNWFHEHGWKRGLATGFILLLAFLAFCALFALIIPAIITGFKQLITAAPAMLARLQRWLATLGIDVSTTRIQDEIKKNSQHIVTSAVSVTGGLLKVGASIIGGIFRWATIALFLFYFVAEGPQVRRSVCRLLPPDRQEQVLFVWEQAITKTGGYFYSRLLLAAINGTGLYITLRVLGVPFAAPLAIFSGTVAEFIPIVGTYIAGLPPVLVALLFSPRDAIGVIVVSGRVPVDRELLPVAQADEEDHGAASRRWRSPPP